MKMTYTYYLVPLTGQSSSKIQEQLNKMTKLGYRAVPGSIFQNVDGSFVIMEQENSTVVEETKE